MAIFQGSRYATARIIPVPDADGVYRPTVFPTRTVAEPTDYVNHRVAIGDRLDLLANEAYGDPELWWVIADANQDRLFYPDELTPGMVIRIPRST